MNAEISPIIKEKAPEILAEIKKASSILLHCHPSPDPDSVGSALAMKFALEQLGKKATVIKGDSDIPEAFMHFPGVKEIVPKNFGEIDLSDFDLFISLDCSTPNRVSSHWKKDFIPPFKVINIDHHRSNEMFGSINLVEENYPATAQILFDLFVLWQIDMVEDISANLFIGIYTDTGGLKFRNTSARSYSIMSELVKKVPNFTWYVDVIDSSNSPESLAYEGAALSNIEVFLGGKLAIASVSNAVLKEKNITDKDMGGIPISNILRSVIGWDIDVELVEQKPGQIKVSIRTRDDKKYDLSKLAVALGGGGHKAAAGAGIVGRSLDDAKKLVVAKAKELYNL